MREFQFPALQTRKELGLEHFRKDLWGCYQGQRKKLTGASPVTIPQATARHILAAVPLLVSKGLFTWREEDPRRWNLTLRWIYMQKFRTVSCPSREG